MQRRFLYPFFVIILSFLFPFHSYAQPTWTFEPFGKQKKPEQYETKKLPSEKTEDRKFTFLRRVSQNTLTHYNFYYNANNKLNAVIEQSKSSKTNDYSGIISFYPYDLDATASQQTELDSVIYKSTAAILLHDLRTDWVDNMYLLIGKSYYYRKQFDSAALTFQFINYNLFPRKKREDDNRIVGTNTRAEKTKLSIADREKRNFIQKLVTLPPSRNDALIWLARTFIEQELYGESAGLISILQEDPNLPKRLKDDLNEVTAYWYFKQEGYDSAAVYLEKALSNAANKIDKARWRYLLAQLYEMTGSYDKASENYQKAAKGTVDPLMDIYAHLNKAKMLRNDGDKKQLDNNISKLLKMAKQDKFETYRDIIYHSIGLLFIQKPDTVSAIKYFKQSLSKNTGNVSYKTKTHYELGKIAYHQRRYMDAADHYDSVDVAEPSILIDSAEVADRKSALRLIATQYGIIQLEDSLQMIASLLPADRDAFIKKLLKKDKKSKGKYEEENIGGQLNSGFNNSSNAAPVDLFSNSSSSKGEWYFYNANMKSRGFGEFKGKWGKRDNVDNWRRKSAMTLGMSINDPKSGGDPMMPSDGDSAKQASGAPVANTYDALMLNVPVTKEKLDSSNAKISASLIILAKSFENDLKDYDQAILTYLDYLHRFPIELLDGEVYLGLYHCYTKMGNKERAAFYKNLLDNKFAESKFSKMLNDPLSLQPEKNNPLVSKKYEMIYNLFVQGSFDSALALKKVADATYGDQYWTPQLLFIESIYHVKCEEDSLAIEGLNALIAKYPGTPFVSKAQSLIDVISRRKEIESYLEKLEVTRVEEEGKILIPDQDKVVLNDSKVSVPIVPKLNTIKTIPKIADSSIKIQQSNTSGAFKWRADKQHVVVMLFNNVDIVYQNEAKNAFARYNRNNNNSTIVIDKDTISAQKPILVFGNFESAEDALFYAEKIKKAASTEVSWLQSSKYSFLLISKENLQLLKSNKDIEAYKKLLDNQYPGKF